MNEEVVTILIEEGSEVNLADSCGMAALLYAAKYSHNPAVVEILFDNSAKVAMCNNNGFLALDYAADNEYINRSSAFWALNDGMYNGF